MPARALPVLAILLLGAAAADPLPAGVERQGSVITMRPIGDDMMVSDAESGLRTSTTKVLSTADHDLFTHAFEAANRGDWPTALSLAQQGRNPIAKALVHWRYVQDKNSKAPFADIDAFLKANPDWPRRNIIQVRAEEAMDPATAPGSVIAWFTGRNPISALGMIRLGDALIATGKTEWGKKLVRDGWAAGTFELPDELAIVQKDGSFLTPDVDKRRLDNLLWSDQITAARREMARVDDDTQRLANARIAVKTDPRRAAKALSELSADLAGNGALLFDRARAARKNADFDAAAELLTRPAVRELFKTRAAPVWAETHIVAREMLKQKKIPLAYKLVADTGVAGGSEMSDSEFLAGWIALRHLNDAASALPHFKRLTNGVSRPISLARGYYWSGRAYEALGDNENAYKAYKLAADAPETFYGQLALTRIDPSPTLRLTTAKVDATPSAATFNNDDLVKAIRVLADLGAQDLMRGFALRYLELHPGAAHGKQLAAMLTEMGYRDVALRVAKVLGYDGVNFPIYAYPVIAVPEYKGPPPVPEQALVHAIIRQETEFDPQSVSHANARGMMQLTPAAARTNAKRAGLPYRPNALTTDVTYNMQLGMTEFSSYLANWGNSVIVSAAAYNAGATNAKRWIETFGDPRSPSVDPIDWIESISYGETRNYVQRIVENLQVYRARLGGRDTPLRILNDLYVSPPPQKILTPPAPPPPPVPTKKPKDRRTTSN
jgi:Soluble lytic murein transglycosylase and related regulatory proteins (some contain LysM/invasin domains)